MQLFMLLVQLLVILRVPNEMQSRGVLIIFQARDKDNRLLPREVHKSLGKQTAKRVVSRE